MGVTTPGASTLRKQVPCTFVHVTLLAFLFDEDIEGIVFHFPTHVTLQWL